MKYFYVIETSKSEWTSSYDFITDNFEEARMHVKDFVDWFCNKGTCTIIKFDQNFRQVKRWKYGDDKLVVLDSNLFYQNYEREDHD